jgi:peptidylprolyl isomerase
VGVDAEYGSVVMKVKLALALSAAAGAAVAQPARLGPPPKPAAAPAQRLEAPVNPAATPPRLEAPANPAASPAPARPSAPPNPLAPPQVTPAPASATPAQPTAGDWKPVDPANTLLIETTRGRVLMELRPELAPGHVARIKTLTRKGYYDGALFYRVLKNFMAQTGDKGSRTFTSDLPNLKAEFTFTTKPLGYHAIGDYAGGEVGFIGATPVRIDTPPGGPMVGSILFCPGVAAFAHYKDPDSANSQFFILRADQPGLARTFTAFGRVIVGMDVVQALNDGEPPANPDKMTRVRILSDVPVAERPNASVLDAASPAFTGLVQTAARENGANFDLCDIGLSDIVH